MRFERSARPNAFAAVFLATFLASTGSVFVITLLALHVYQLSSAQVIASFVPITQWAAAIPCVFVVARLRGRYSSAGLMAAMFAAMALTSLLMHLATAFIAPLLLLLAVRGAADFLAKNARAQWLKVAMDRAAHPQRLGSLIATSQYLGTFVGGLVALGAAVHCTVQQALNIDILLCGCAALLARAAAQPPQGQAAVASAVTSAGASAAAAPRRGATGWAALFAQLRQRPALCTLFVALVGFAGLFQGFHQAAKIGLVVALSPLPAADIPGILQALAGLGIVLGATVGGGAWLYRTQAPLAVCALAGAAAMLLVGAAAGHAVQPVLAVYFVMMFLFEIGFTIANNRLLIEMPPAQIPAMHSASYVLSCVAMIATSFLSATAFDAFGLAGGAGLVLAVSVLSYGLMNHAIRRKGASDASPDVC